MWIDEKYPGRLIGYDLVEAIKVSFPEPAVELQRLRAEAGALRFPSASRWNGAHHCPRAVRASAGVAGGQRRR